MYSLCKYGICDISSIVNESFIFLTVLMSHIPYLLTHLINSKYILLCNVSNISGVVSIQYFGNTCSESQVQLASIPFGVIPLGKENRFYTSQHPHKSLTDMPARYPKPVISVSMSSQYHACRTIGEATMAIIKGRSKPVHIMEIQVNNELPDAMGVVMAARKMSNIIIIILMQPEKGRTLYAMSSIRWGVIKEAYDNRDRYVCIVMCFNKQRTSSHQLNICLIGHE